MSFTTTSEVIVLERPESSTDKQDPVEIVSSDAEETVDPMGDVDEHVTEEESTTDVDITEGESSDTSAEGGVSEDNAQKKKRGRPPKNKKKADTVDQKTGLKSGNLVRYKLSEDHRRLGIENNIWCGSSNLVPPRSHIL